MRARLALTLAVLTFLATAGLAVAAPAQPTYRPAVIVAVADTGVNPYHEIYRRPQNTEHPCTWVRGFTDCSIPALRLSLGKHKDYAAAVEADREVWEAVEPHQWYWIPGTNIIGAVCENPRGGGADSVVAAAGTCILDDHGHGTGTTSSVLTEAPDALLLVHEGNAGAYDLATAPVAPDVQSHSWGPPAPLPTHVAGPALCSQPYRRAEAVTFLAAGNEAPVPTFLDCGRQHADVHVVGGANPGHWSPSSWSMYDFASWFCRPTAQHDSLTEDRPQYCGTSFSAPTAAGAAAAALHRLRVADRYTGRNTRTHVSRTVTRAQFDEALRRAASYDPEAKFDDECRAVVCTRQPLPEQAPWVFWGYGWLDSTVVDEVVACARGRSCPDKPAQAQEWNARRQEVRAATSPAVMHPVPQQDAGSDRDAGWERDDAVAVRPGHAYDAQLQPFALYDISDGYLFPARAGQRISVTASMSYDVPVPEQVRPYTGCWVLFDPEDTQLFGSDPAIDLISVGCDSAQPHGMPTDVVAPQTGTYRLAYSTGDLVLRQDYRFTVSVKG
jgi:hypothetical protein